MAHAGLDIANACTCGNCSGEQDPAWSAPCSLLLTLTSRSRYMLRRVSDEGTLLCKQRQRTEFPMWRIAHTRLPSSGHAQRPSHVGVFVHAHAAIADCQPKKRKAQRKPWGGGGAHIYVSCSRLTCRQLWQSQCIEYGPQDPQAKSTQHHSCRTSHRLSATASIPPAQSCDLQPQA